MKRFFIICFFLCFHISSFCQTLDQFSQWALHADHMNVVSAWAEGARGQNIKIAVIDGGIELSHPDLRDNLLPGYDATQYYTGVDTEGGTGGRNIDHGTSCAGIIGAVDNGIGIVGVAPHAKIIPIKSSNVVDLSNGNIISYRDDWAADAIRKAVDMGADVISCSWGVSLESGIVKSAFEYAWMKGRGGKGCVIVVAAGNQNSTSVPWSVTLPGTLSVGAIRQDGTRHPESNYGEFVDVYAPGDQIYTTDLTGSMGRSPGDYHTFDKTSAACPNAAGVVALMLSLNPKLTFDKTISLITSTADYVGGHKRVNALKAVRAARQVTGPYVSAVSATDYVYNYSNSVQFYVEAAPGYLNYTYKWTITSDQSCGASYDGPRFYSNGNGVTATTAGNWINVNTGTCDGTFWVRCEAISPFGVRLYSPRLFKVRYSSNGGCNFSVKTYPNPATSGSGVNVTLLPPDCEFHMKAFTEAKPETAIHEDQIEYLQVYDYVGNLRHREQGTALSHKLNTDLLSKGLYYLVIHTAQGKEIRQRLVIQ